ncbi:NAD(P)/FAD-dependent oxidoreductase [Marinomonas dokdonensis]|uniref:NAD(P)/FAD-dependent oxidoreductase n=1 Tax=Marinomonas dokdonensis TaxID=328224 RepID=UPI0040557860
MSKDNDFAHENIAVIGAGIIGLSSALWLQKAGYKVTIIDRQSPGEGASFGNAGVMANFSCLPFTRFKMLPKIPKLLANASSPLSISKHYIPEMLPYGWHYMKSCFRYKHSRQALTNLQSKAFESDQVLLNMTSGQSLIHKGGCLALFASQESIEKAKTGDMLERQNLGVNLSFVDHHQVKELEPALQPFYAGGVYYPDTRFTVSPIQLSRCYAKYFVENGGKIIKDQVNRVKCENNGVSVQTTTETHYFDRLVIAAGSASKKLIDQLGCKLPLVSERGYHIMIRSDNPTCLTRPVAWLDKSVFLSPIEESMRLAGMAEFAHIDAPATKLRIDNLKAQAKEMLGDDIEYSSEWFGSRPATPDTIPIIGHLPSNDKVTLAFGHGHIGLTLSAVTGRLVSELVQGVTACVDPTPFSPKRFL